ncbi:uncharacterized protein STEHIDRAFT_116593 [Stereum hirsutum FP-91666 SS1]|uniref:G-protein coupled receptors family 2 profile 2 domain-containing protein n=1 Tax=Stereum hirsutum (strain FP-91666) TaxID=721885 RepID=R7RVY9_STEHR|nr:uncharacterized protein STEHIDRAFT_116593 [Stereum hirsutum FP-91666 SS1]EIM79404.1 hypothetical protein STEHIDRAFT_116593 [Stereum hirsutum FP-91666 SS1]
MRSNAGYKSRTCTRTRRLEIQLQNLDRSITVRASDMDFVWTTDKQDTSNRLWAITSAVGAGLCLLVLVVISIAWRHPASRPDLDRVSFRIVIYTLIANTLFGIASAVGGQIRGPGWGCGLSIWLLQLTLEFSSFMLFCIALNLQRVTRILFHGHNQSSRANFVVHGLNGRRMEKFYVIGSLFMSILLTIPPYATGQYGWDPLLGDCWYTNDDRARRLAWQLGTQLIWTASTVVGEICASLTVMVYMLMHRVTQKHVLAPREASYTISDGPSPTIDASAAPQVIYANAYKGIIIRIALYPIASCVFNLLGVVPVVHATATDGIHDQNEYRVLLLTDKELPGDILYGGRTIVYALLAASDPALLRAIKSLLHHIRSAQTESLRNGPPTAITEGSDDVVVSVELTTVHSSDFHQPHSARIDQNGSSVETIAQGSRTPQNRHNIFADVSGIEKDGGSHKGSEVKDAHKESVIHSPAQGPRNQRIDWSEEVSEMDIDNGDRAETLSKAREDEFQRQI